MTRKFTRGANPTQFLANIYDKQCSPGDYIVLSAKKGKTWKEYPIRYESKNQITKRLRYFFNDYPQDEWDLYWSPMPFSSKARTIQNGLDTKYLAQDIDEVEDIYEVEPEPNFIWESSPGKYQGLWELDRYIDTEEYEDLNRALSEYGDFDSACDYPHVYRIPGTINHKYKNKPQVGSVETLRNKLYKPKSIKEQIGYKKRKVKKDKIDDLDLSSSITERQIYAKYNIPQDIRELLAAEDVDDIDDRSETIWYVENKLYEIGLKPKEIIKLIKGGVFNKYRGRRDEDERIKSEFQKIIGKNATKKEQKQSDKLKVTTFGELMGKSFPRQNWLVKGFWGYNSHGIVAGMPKTFKSTLVQDFAVSVASGKPFLGQFEVVAPGPVILIQNENTESLIQDRTRKMLNHKGHTGRVKIFDRTTARVRMPEDIPFYSLNQTGFTFDNENFVEAIEELIIDVKPRLVIFDPLYLMFEGDMNTNQELSPVLQWLLYLKNEYDTSVMLVHHYNKGGSEIKKGGARMSGSNFLYSWIESAWYLQREEPEPDLSTNLDEDLDTANLGPSIVTMTREFRMAGSHRELDIALDIGEFGSANYEVEVKAHIPKDENGEAPIETNESKTRVILNYLENMGKSTIAEISKYLNYPESEVQLLLGQAVSDETIRIIDGEYTY